MKQIIASLSVAMAMLTVVPEIAEAARRRVVVKRQTVVVRPGHPIARAARRTVIVRPARRPVVVTGAVVFLPPVIWAATVVALPPRDRLVWEDSELLHRDEGWVDLNFGVDNRGEALYLKIDGRAQLDFAEITFDNNQVRVVDFNEHTQGPGVYPLLDFADGRHVKTVRILARTPGKEAKLTVLMRK